MSSRKARPRAAKGWNSNSRQRLESAGVLRLIVEVLGIGL